MGSAGVRGDTFPELPLYEEGTLDIISYEVLFGWGNWGTVSEKEGGYTGSGGMLYGGAREEEEEELVRYREEVNEVPLWGKISYEGWSGTSIWSV